MCVCTQYFYTVVCMCARLLVCARLHVFECLLTCTFGRTFARIYAQHMHNAHIKTRKTHLHTRSHILIRTIIHYTL